MSTLVSISQVGLLVSGVALLGVTYRTYTMRERATASTFAILVALLGITALCNALTAASGWTNKFIWLQTNLAIPVVLLYFSFDYYGVDAFRSREWFGAILTPAVLGSVGGSLLILGTPLATGDGTAPFAAVASLPSVVFEYAGTLDEIGYYYTAALVLVAVGLVGRTVVRYEHLDTRLGALIAFIGGWPWLGNFLFPQVTAASSEPVGLVVLSTGYVLSAVVAVLVVGPAGLFQSSPAAGNAGPELALRSMDDAVVVADSHGQILRLNEVARETFGVTDSDGVGRQVSDVLGSSMATLDTGDPVSLSTASGMRQFEITQSDVLDRTDSKRGTVIVLRDVTARQTREQRLEVLNRVLRHNLRNEASSILARAELISADGERTSQAEHIIDTTKDLVDTAQRAREIEDMMRAAVGDSTTDLARTVESVVGDVESTCPDVEVTTALPDDAILAVPPRTIETVLFNIVENAAVHNDADDPIVVVSADESDDTVTIAVSDNGPGIPDHERSVLDAGEEDQLEHGSGLGLWAVQWGVVQMGGDLTISDNDPRGTTVTLSLPAVTTPPGEDSSVAMTT